MGYFHLICLGHMKFFKIIAVFYLLFICGCKEKKLPENINYYRNNCLNVDSIWNYFLNNKEQLTASFISHVEQRLFFAGKQDDVRKLLLYSTTYLKHNSDTKLADYQVLNEAYFYLWQQKLDSCFQKVLLLERNLTSDTSFILATDQLIGSYWFLMNELDSANSYFKKGYLFALNAKRDDYIQTFSLNLGALAFNKNFIGTAIYYFSKAYKLNVKHNTPNFMLNNNLSAALMTQKKYNEAEELLLKDTFNLSEKNLEYYGIISKLNFCCLKQEQHQWDIAENYLNSCPENKIPATVYNDWLFLKLRQIEHIEPNQAKVFYENNKLKFLNSIDYFLLKLGDVFVRQAAQYPSIYNDFVNPKYFPQGKVDSLNYKSKYYYYMLVSEIGKSNGNYQVSSSFERKANIALAKNINISDSLKIEDISTNIALVQLSLKLDESEQNLILKNRQLANSWISIVFLFSAFSILILLGYFIIKNKAQRTKLANALLEIKSKEADYLEEEKRLNSKIHTMSKIIIQKSQTMAETIKKGPSFNSPEIKAVQKELEKLSRIESLVNNQNKVQIIERDFEFLWSNYEVLNELNETQKRILILSIEQFKPKEIAMSLNLSYPYVRNVQTALRKSLLDLKMKDFIDLKN